MKRVVLSLVGGGCLLVAAVALGQTSVRVAQNAPNGKDVKNVTSPERICLQWPRDYIDDNTVLFLCEDWPEFTTCDEDPEAAYEYASPDSYFPCDCGIEPPNGEPYSCQQISYGNQKFQGLHGCQKLDTDLTLPVTEHVVMRNNVLGVATAHVLYKEPPQVRYTYIRANLQKNPQGQDRDSVPAIVYHIQLRNPPGYKKQQKDFYLALECESSERTVNAPPVDLDIVHRDKALGPPYYAFTKKGYGEENAKGPMLMLTHKAIQP